jgi:uncharacterized RDD family membrane protein YckC
MKCIIAPFDRRENSSDSKMTGGKVTKALGKAVDSIIECIDVDGVVRRVEINALLERVDFNSLLDDIDVDHHLQRVDLKRLLERVDLDALVERLDVGALVEKSDVGSIMLMSTTGVFTHVLDSLRVKLVEIDLIILRITKLKRWKDTRGALPMAPGDQEDLDYDECPRNRAEKAVAVQGRYAGIFSRGVSIFFDCACLTLSFAVSVIIIQLYWILFVGDIRKDLRTTVNKDSIWALLNREYLWTFILYCIYWYFYFFMSVVLTGQTLGMGLVGIRLADAKSGLEISTSQALVRTLLLPITVTLIPALNILGLIRKDGRMLHDILSGTGCVYRWNARMARLRKKAELAEEEAEVKRRQMERARRVSVRTMNSVPAIETRAVSKDSVEAEKER